MSQNPLTLIDKATRHIRDILSIAIAHDGDHKALVIYDTEDELTRILTEAYRHALPDAQFVDFSSMNRGGIISLFDALSPQDLVVLIQSDDFRLNEFRIRIQLFQRELRVIDHRHLRRSTDHKETYIEALAYDPSWYRGTGSRLLQKLETVETLTISEGDAILTIQGGLEAPKPNLGDYTGMKNIGGTFPIGEVFTEAKDLSKVNGALIIYAFADTDFEVRMYDPFRVDITDGLVTGWSSNAPTSFADVIEQIKMNERPLLREIGFGLNRAITREHYLPDITAFERTHGLHFSLGEKHSVFKKAGITADKTRFHVDVFPVVSEVLADGTVLFKDDVYHV